MRIHLQSHATVHNFPLTPELWDAACARAPDVASGHHVTFGDTPVALETAFAEAEVLIAQSSAISSGLAEGMPKAGPALKIVYVTSAGLERLAPFTWLPEGVALLNNRGTHAAKAGEYGLMALLMLANRVPALATAQRDGKWLPLHGGVLAGRRVVVVGLGALGGSTAQHAHDFGMHVTGVRANPAPHPGCHRVVGMEAFDSVLPEADMLFLAPPLTDATRGLLTRARIGLLPKGAGLVNIGRGALVDQDAVLDALDSGHLGGGVLDVFVPEPLPDGHRVWRTPNLIATPHTSADDPATYNPRSLDIFFENLRAYLDGTPMPNRFDVAKGY